MSKTSLYETARRINIMRSALIELNKKAKEAQMDVRLHQPQRVDTIVEVYANLNSVTRLGCRMNAKKMEYVVSRTTENLTINIDHVIKLREFCIDIHRVITSNHITEQEITHAITASYENKFDVIDTGSCIIVSGNTMQATITPESATFSAKGASIDINEADYLKALCRSLMGGARL